MGGDERVAIVNRTLGARQPVVMLPVEIQAHPIHLRDGVRVTCAWPRRIRILRDDGSGVLVGLLCATQTAQ